MLESGLGGRVCLVTGAAKGIGLAAARLLEGEGAKLVLADSDADTLDETIEHFGRLDVLIHCAGIYRVSKLPDVSDAEWDAVMDVNLRSSFLLCQGAVALMAQQGDGRIVLFGSFAARTGGLRASAPYAASKAGVEGLTRHVAAYGGPLGVRINCVHPGFTMTPMTEILTEEARAEAYRNTPLRRGAPPQEQATMAVVLASDLASFVHGATLDVNGGMYMA
jgi:NAD(P)-dependent dehydrogenase (short-subunit alcohol dehydrogenase family)